MFEVDLRQQVTRYDPFMPNWGGPASCQMAMNGYPAGGSCYIQQTDIWNYIQAHNQEPKTWYSDPFAVTKALNDLCPPPNDGGWDDASDHDQQTVLFRVLSWMARYRFASLVCTFGHDYWAVVVYYQTADDPRTVDNTTLLRIGFYQVGDQLSQYQEVDGAVWTQSLSYWGVPCGVNAPCGQSWNNKFVAVGEPPKTKGQVHVEDVSRSGDKVISPKEAVSAAQSVVAERRRENSESLMRKLSGGRAGQPMLVRESTRTQTRTGRAASNVQYYVVPFREKHEVNKRGESLARFSVLVNAFTGRFEELAIFPQPVRYISEREVRTIASHNLGLSRADERKLQLELVSQPVQGYVSSSWPAWNVSTPKSSIAITQSGVLLGIMLNTALRGA
jgi:hypothetical protein